MADFYREPESGETLRDYLREMLSTVPRAFNGPGVSQGPGWVTIAKDTAEDFTPEQPEVFPAKIIGSQKAVVPGLEGIPGPDGKCDRYIKVGGRVHNYQWLYAWEEVQLKAESFDSGTGEDDPEGDLGAGSYLAVLDMEHGREYQVPSEGNMNLAFGAAFNVRELLHKQDSEVCEAEQHWIFGANIKQNQYPPNYQPVGWGPMDDHGHVGTENPNNPQSEQNSIVLMNKLVQLGTVLYCFNMPGYHLGTCHG